MLVSLSNFLTGGKMTPRQRSWTEVSAFVIGVLVLLGGLYAYGAAKEAAISGIQGDVKRLEEGQQHLNKRLDRFEDKLDVLIERGNK